jgi:hypothetical protein
MVLIDCIDIGCGDGLELHFEQTRDRLGKHEVRRLKIRVMLAAISRPPTGVDGELRQIGEPFFFVLLTLSPDCPARCETHRD